MCVRWGQSALPDGKVSHQSLHHICPQRFPQGVLQGLPPHQHPSALLETTRNPASIDCSHRSPLTQILLQVLKPCAHWPGWWLNAGITALLSGSLPLGSRKPLPGKHTYTSVVNLRLTLNLRCIPKVEYFYLKFETCSPKMKLMNSCCRLECDISPPPLPGNMNKFELASVSWYRPTKWLQPKILDPVLWDKFSSKMDKF